MNGTILKIRGMSARYDRKTVISGINLDVCANDFLGITGPNGGGKTTLLKVILGLLRPAEGSVEYYRDGLPCKNLRIGYMPQQAQIDRRFPITVHEVVMSGMNAERRLLQGFTEEQKQRALKVEERLGLDTIAGKPIGQLSGGQRQRTLLGRAIVSDPELLVLDEPDAYIDNFFENRLYSVLEDMNRKCAIIMVSHNIGAIMQKTKSTVYVDHVLEHRLPDGTCR